MRKIGRQRRLRGPAIIGSAAIVAIAVGGSLAATQASAAPVARAGSGGGLSISKQYFGSTVEPYTGKETAVYRYTLSNASGMSVKILTYGGDLQEINVPARNGTKADVILGFKTLQDYVTEDSPPVTANGGPYFGELIGRYGNRIAKGTFTLNQPGVGPGFVEHAIYVYLGRAGLAGNKCQAILDNRAVFAKAETIGLINQYDRSEYDGDSDTDITDHQNNAVFQFFARV